MSKATKAKYVVREVLEEFPIPDDQHPIMRVTASVGNNLIEVEDPEGKHVLCSLPSKFQHTIWIKKGDHVIIEWVEAVTKVQADIMHILYPEQIKFLKKRNMWPSQFLLVGSPEIHRKQSDTTMTRVQTQLQSLPGVNNRDIQFQGESSELEEDMSDIFVNRNRRNHVESEASESESESDS
eukprot:CFRG0488T1